jgi:AmiR/NasT family two-component response regulator
MEGHRIIIADDEPQVLSTLAQLLESAGQTVVGKAATGEEAVWLNQTLDADVALLDLKMPGMDGLEAAQRIMSTKPLPVVICTAYCDDDAIDSAANLGVYAYIVKPCRLADLLPTISMAISRFHDVRLLKNEVESLEEALENRKLMEQAKGIVMRTRRVSEEDAHRFLQRESQRQSKPLPDLAKAIILAEKTFANSLFSSSSASKKAA